MVMVISVVSIGDFTAEAAYVATSPIAATSQLSTLNALQAFSRVYTTNPANSSNTCLDSQYEDNDTISTAYPLPFSGINRTTYGYLNNTNKTDYTYRDIDCYRFTIYSTDVDMTVTLVPPAGCDYDLVIVDDSYNYNGWISNRGSDSPEVIRINRPTTGSKTYYAIVFIKNVDDYDPNYMIYNYYKLNFLKRWETNNKYTANVNPTKLTCAGGTPLTTIKYSNIGSVDLTNTAAIPDTAQVTGVHISGSISPSNTGMNILVGNSSSPVFQETLFSAAATIADFYNSYYPVKVLWQCQYTQYATTSSSYSNVKIEITYRYDSAYQLYGY